MLRSGKRTQCKSTLTVIVTKTSSIEVRAGQFLGAPGSNVHDMVARQSTRAPRLRVWTSCRGQGLESGWGRGGGSD